MKPHCHQTISRSLRILWETSFAPPFRFGESARFRPGLRHLTSPLFMLWIRLTAADAFSGASEHESDHTPKDYSPQTPTVRIYP
jgi:hypothetical protein